MSIRLHSLRSICLKSYNLHLSLPLPAEFELFPMSSFIIARNASAHSELTLSPQLGPKIPQHENTNAAKYQQPTKQCCSLVNTEIDIQWSSENNRACSQR